LRLAEVISAESTSPETADEAMAFCDSIDRLTIRVKDTPGFIVNRSLVPFYSLAYTSDLREGLAAFSEERLPQFKGS
jgi:3-hydroxyacyl-CoA dehydrogenase